MRHLGELGCHYVTYGLAPLAHTPSSVLRWVRDHTRWLYHFDGLRAFKAKLCPDGWRPVYLAYPESGQRQSAAIGAIVSQCSWRQHKHRQRRSAITTARATVDALAAFAGGSLWRFGLATMHHRAAWVIQILALLLVPWTVAMGVSDSERWFPSLAVKSAWIGFDLILFGFLMALARRWRKRYAVALTGAAGCDFVLGCVQAGFYNLPRSSGILDWIIVSLALGAPLFATLFLWHNRDRAMLYTRF